MQDTTQDMTRELRISWIVAVAIALIVLAEAFLFGGYPIASWVYSLDVALRHGDCPGTGSGTICSGETLGIFLFAGMVYILLLLGLFLLTVSAALIQRRHVWLAGMLAPPLLAVVLLLNSEWLAWKVGLGQLRVTLMILGCGIAGPLVGIIYSFVSSGRPPSKGVRTEAV